MHQSNQAKRLNLNQLKKEPSKINATSLWFIIFILFYALQAVLSLFFNIFPPLIDFITVIAVIIIFFLIHVKTKVKVIVPFLLGFGFLFHIIGLYQIIPYNQDYTGTLYGAPQLNYHYDIIPHSIGFGLIAIAVCSIFYPYFKKIFKTKKAILFFMIFFMLGFGALNEIIEYLGYVSFGYGEGFIEFGDGDISPDAGPWQNASIDLISNFFGALVSIALFLFIMQRKEKNTTFS